MRFTGRDDDARSLIRAGDVARSSGNECQLIRLFLSSLVTDVFDKSDGRTDGRAPPRRVNSLIAFAFCRAVVTPVHRRPAEVASVDVTLDWTESSSDRLLDVLTNTRRAADYVTAQRTWLPDDRSVHYPARCPCSLNRAAAGQQQC